MKRTLDPATIQRASRSTQLDFRIAFSNNLAITVSSSEVLVDQSYQLQLKRESTTTNLPASKLPEAMGEISVVSDRNPS